MKIRKVILLLCALTFNMAHADEVIVDKPLSFELSYSADSSAIFSKDEPAVVFRKWGGEGALKVKYGGIKSLAEKSMDEKIQWGSGDQELRAFDLKDGSLELELILNVRPSTNTFDFTLENYDNLNFFQQPPFKNLDADGSTWEDNGRGGTRRRPEIVNDSIAVYHKTKTGHIRGQSDYASGKAYHIYRIKAIDANGASVWGKMTVLPGILRVIVPPDFIQLAALPITVDPIFGFSANCALGSADNAGGNYIYAKASSTPGSSGSLDSISACLATFGGGNSVFNPALYSDVAAAPTTRLAAVNSGGTAITSAVLGLLTTNITYGSITSGVQYWLGVSANYTNDYSWAFDSGGDICVGGGAYSAAWPDPASSDQGCFNEIIYIYGTYTAAAAGNPPSLPAGVIKRSGTYRSSVSR